MFGEICFCLLLAPSATATYLLNSTGEASGCFLLKRVTSFNTWLQRLARKLKNLVFWERISRFFFCNPANSKVSQELFRAHSHFDIMKGGTQGFPRHEVSDKQEVLFEDVSPSTAFSIRQHAREVRWVRRDTRLTIRVTVWGRGLGGAKSQRVGRLRCRTQPGLSPASERTGKLAPLTPFYSIIVPVVQFFGRSSFLLWQSWLVRLRLT